MRRLICMRHGKSDWESPALTDHARPLRPRGRRSSHKVALALSHRGFRPDLVLCSDAVRAKETFELMRPVFGEVRVDYVPELYLGGLSAVVQAVIDRQNGGPKGADSARTILVIGHNPGLEACVAGLSPREVALKTADAAVLRSLSDAPWRTLFAESPAFSLEEHIRARSLLGPSKEMQGAVAVGGR